jgi:hypothetical protein
LLGRYENFPTVTHGHARLTHQGSTRDLQQAILHSLHRFNSGTARLDNIAAHLSPTCAVGFEFGIAEEMVFNYLDEEELQRAKAFLAQGEFSTLDFFCTLSYHAVNDGGKHVALKFDYHLIRFTFRARTVELHVHHERGMQRVPIEELITFIANSINEELTQRRLGRLTVKHLRAL